MKGKAFGLNENIEKSRSAARLFGESFQLEDGLAAQFGSQWHIEGYIDEYQIEHIRVFRMSEVSDSDAGQWEVLSYADEEAPLELLMLQDEM